MANSDFWRELATSFQSVTPLYEFTAYRQYYRELRYFLPTSSTEPDWELQGTPAALAEFDAMARRGATMLTPAPTGDLAVAWLEALWKEATEGPVRSGIEILGKDRSGILTELRGKIDYVFQASSALCRKFESDALQTEFEERQRNDPQKWSPLRQRFEAFKSIRELHTGPHERIPEALVRDAIADQLGIKPEEVTWKQITFAMAGLLRDYPALTLVPTERALSQQPSENASQPDSSSPQITVPSSNMRLDLKERMPPFRWQNIDHRLVVLKLADLSEEMRVRIKAEESRIRFENRLNLNGNTVPSLVLRMKEELADEWAGRVYEIYCGVWQTQGYVKSAAFVRAICAHIVRMLGVRARSIAREFSRTARFTNLPFNLRTAHLTGLDLRMRRFQGRWQRRLEIEAKECEHAERRLRVSQTMQSGGVATRKTSTEALPELFRQPSAGERQQNTASSEGRLNRRKPGRTPKVNQSFVVCAGTLWRKVISGSDANVSDDQLREIASALDAAGQLPPSAHLEGKYARELKAFNSRNSNSKTGPVKTWSQLISLGDKDLLRGMRRLLSRCAKRLDDARPLSGN